MFGRRLDVLDFNVSWILISVARTFQQLFQLNLSTRHEFLCRLVSMAGSTSQDILSVNQGEQQIPQHNGSFQLKGHKRRFWKSKKTNARWFWSEHTEKEQIKC